MVNLLLPKLVRAALDNDLRSIRSISVQLIRQLKLENPLVADEIANALNLHGVGFSAKRSLGSYIEPIDSETKMSLASVEEPIECHMPIFTSNINTLVEDFINERKNAGQLLSNGLMPASSILLYGPPGVGKTELAKYLSGVLNLKLITIDLASSVSSFLGKTGQNIKMIFEYAKKEPAILFLDEFDAIAKKRDDSSDLGELKRIVNVLLKEMEDWPSNSILIAATNHPDLLDKAIWRRFERAIEICLPSEADRLLIVQHYLGLYNLNQELLNYSSAISALTEGCSGSDINSLIERVKRKALLSSINPIEIIFFELSQLNNLGEVEFYKIFCKALKKYSDLSFSEIGDLLGKSKSSVQYYVNGRKK